MVKLRQRCQWSGGWSQSGADRSLISCHSEWASLIDQAKRVFLDAMKNYDVSLLDRYSKTYESKEMEWKSATIVFCGRLPTEVDQVASSPRQTINWADLAGSQDRSDRGKFGLCTRYDTTDRIGNR